MNYVELEEKINTRLSVPLSRRKIAEIIGTSAQNLNKKIHNLNTQVLISDIQKIEKALSISILEPENCITIDYYPETCGSCGNGVFEFSTLKEQLTIPKKNFFKKISPAKQYFVINALGNSMEPLIYEGDKLIIEHYEGEQIQDNKPYLFCYNDELFIKRLAKNVDQLIIIPENKMYDVRKLIKEEINQVTILGQVVGLMRDFR